MRRADALRVAAPAFAETSIRFRLDDFVFLIGDLAVLVSFSGSVRRRAAGLAVVAFFAVVAGWAEARDATPRVFFAAAFFTGDDFLAAVPRVDAAGPAVVLDVARLLAVEPGFVVLDNLPEPPFLTDVFFAKRGVDTAFFVAPRFATVGVADAAVFFVTVFFAGGRLLAAAFGVAAFPATVFFAAVLLAAVFLAAIFLAAVFFAAVFFAAVFLTPPALPAAARPEVFFPEVPVVLAMHGLLVARFDCRNMKARTRTPCSCEIRVSKRGRDHRTFMEPAIG